MSSSLDMLNFSANLRFACRYYPSISAVCRRVGINRQQFNAYVNGNTLPSIWNLKKIADFFGVEESELFMDTESFMKLIDGKRRTSSYADYFTRMAMSSFDDPEETRRELSKYKGYYHCIFNSCGHPGYIIRSIVNIYESRGIMATKTMEVLRYRDDMSSDSRGYIFKRDGILLQASKRLFIYDYEHNVSRTPSLTILFPSNRNTAPVLKGIHLNVSGGASQRPFSVRVLYQTLGPDPDLRQAINQCGLFPFASDRISDDVKALISNEPLGTGHVLGALD